MTNDVPCLGLRSTSSGAAPKTRAMSEKASLVARVNEAEVEGGV